MEIVKRMLQLAFKSLTRIISFSLLLSLFPNVYLAAEESRSADQPVILQLKWKHQFQFAGYYAAELKGFYKEEGLNVKIFQGTAKTDVTEEVLSGRAQFGIGVPDILLEKMNGAPLVLVASIFQHSPAIILSNENKNIKDPSDLIGLRVGVVEKNGEAQIKAILLREGIPLDSVKLINCSGSTNDLLSGKVDALESYITIGPYMLRQKGIIPSIIRPAPYGVDFYGDFIFTSSHEIDSDPERVDAFRRASIKGWEYALNHPEEIIDYILSFKNLDSAITRDFLINESKGIKRLIVPQFIDIGHINVGRWQAIAETFTFLGMHKGDYSLEGFFYSQKMVEEKKWIRIVMMISGGVGFVIIVVSFWVYQLKRIVKQRTRELTQEIQQREKSEELVKEKESSLRAIYDSSLQVHLLLNKHGEIVSYNKRAKEFARKILGKEINLIGKTLDNFLPAENSEKYKEFFSRCLNGEKFNYERILHWPNFNPMWFELLFLPVYDSSGELIGVSLNAMEISNKKKSEQIQTAMYQISEAVNASESTTVLYKKIHDILRELMPVENIFICLYDEKKGTISFPYFVDEFDSAPEPQPFINFEKSLTGYVLKNGKAILADEKLDSQLQHQGVIDLVGEPTKIWLGVPLRIDEKAIGVIVLQDYHNEKTYGESEKQILTFVSEQIAFAIDKKKKEQELKQFAEELKILNANKDRLFSIIAHDLRSPFFALLGLGEILSTEIDNLTKEEVKKFSGELYNAINAQFKFLENLLEWSRLQLGKIDFHPSEVNLFAGVVEVFNRLGGTADRKKIHLINEVDNNIFVLSDETILQSILHNLISNGIKFTHPNGEIHVSALQDGAFINVSVKDNGVGIDKDDLSKLLVSDQQHSTKGTANERGTGLGLLICKELVEKHGGKIWVESELEKGTKFFFSIPVFSNSPYAKL